MELIKGILFFTSVFSKIIPDESESEVTQSCLTLSDPMDCSPPGSSIHGRSTGVSVSRQQYWSGVPLPSPCIPVTVVYSAEPFSLS